MTKLTKGQRIQLFKALNDAFPRWDELEAMVQLQLERNLEAISARSKPLRTVVLDLIIWAESGGYLGELTAAALAEKPENEELKAFATTMENAVRGARSTPPAAPETESREHYERLIWKAVQFAGTADFKAAMTARERAVCRVEFPVGAGRGTGFLVGPDLLFTNYHVLEDFIEQRQPAEAVAFRFDYQASVDGAQANGGRVVKLASRGWLVRESTVKELDFALVRVAEKAGDDPIDGAADPRRWLTPVAHEFAPGEAVFVLQHPKAAPLKIAAGGVAQVQSRRVHYLANTLDGSSGSPCFTSDWQLAALHRGGDNIANVGIPFSAILADLHTDGPFDFV